MYPDKAVNKTNDNKVFDQDKYYGSSQKWLVLYNRDKQAYKLTNIDNERLHLTWDSEHSGKIIAYEGDYRDWYIEKTSDGYFKLRNYKNATMVLDLSSSNPNEQLQAWEDNGTEAQKWSLQRVDVPTFPDGTYNISNFEDYKKVIDHDSSSHRAILREYMGLDSSEWKFEWDFRKQAYKIRTNQ